MVSRHFAQKKMATMPRVEDMFDVGGVIGEGTYGVVFKAKAKNESPGVKGGQPRWYALKGMKSSTSAQRDDGLSIAATREISILRDIKHDNIINAQGIYLSHVRREVWLLFDYAEYDLWSLISRHREFRKSKVANPWPSEGLQKSIMFQVLKGVNYLHANWILHRDLKPANILVMGPGEGHGRVKIGDLGMARLFHSPLKNLSEVDPVVVTFWYRAPELLLGAKHYTKGIDLWAVGCIMAELITTRPLFWAKDDNKSKDPYHKEQLKAIFSSLGFPAHVDKQPTNELEWQDLKHLPHFGRFQKDFPHSFKAPLAGQLPQGIRETLAQMVPDCQQSRQKVALLANLLRPDPQQRITATNALQSQYFKDAPTPTDNVFADIPNLTFPVREFTKESGAKRGGKNSAASNKCSIDTFRKRVAQDETPVTPGKMPKRARTGSRSSAGQDSARGSGRR